MRVGLVVNPIAGMGGRVGLKGTDGAVEEARERGAEPRAPERATEAVAALAERVPDVTLLAGPDEMGADEARAAGVEPTVVGDVDPERTREPASTTAADTRAVVEAFLASERAAEREQPAESEPGASADAATAHAERANRSGVDLVLFVGGDGTAVDVATALDDADVDVPMLGVPAGVKVYSSVFAVTPREAGRIAAEFDRVAEREVNDIDEAAYREGEVRSELRAVRPVPVAEGVQATKQVGGGSVDGLVEGFVEDVEPGRTYVFGPGSTVGAIEAALGIDASPLGVDVWRAGARDASAPSTSGSDADAPSTSGSDADAPSTSSSGADAPPASGSGAGAPPASSPSDAPADELLVTDGTGAEIREATAGVDDVTVVVSPIGGQGFVLGRGNQQIAPDVVRNADLEIVASRSKLDDLGVLRVDTDDEALDESLRGWTKVRIGRYERRMMRIE